jgi:hypothetical protein
MWGTTVKLKLAVNETKTRVYKLPEEKCGFRQCYSPQTRLLLECAKFNGNDGRESRRPNRISDAALNWTSGESMPAQVHFRRSLS